MALKKANNKLCYISLFIYTFLFSQQKIKIFTSFFNKYFNTKLNIYLLVFVYLYESFVSIVFKQSILYKWNIKDYLEHHVTSSCFMLIGYNFGPVKSYSNMIKNIFLINIIEFTRILQTFNSNKTIISCNLLLGSYYMCKLIYYELYESYIYYKNTNNNSKYITSIPVLTAIYHMYIVLPNLFKSNKRFLKEILKHI